MKNLALTVISIFLISSTFAQDSLLWKFSTGSMIHSSPVISGNNLYIGSGDKFLYSVNKNSGEINWKYETIGKVHSTPFVYENTIIFTSSDGKIYSLNKDTGKLLWNFSTGGEKRYDLWDYYISSPVVNHDIVYVGSGDSSIYAIGVNSGEKIWSYKTGGIVHATPVVKDNIVYIGSYDGNFYALNSQTGEIIWKFKTIGETYFPKGEIQKAAVLFDNIVAFGSRDYNVYALDSKTGTGKWNMKEFGSWIVATPLISGDNIYFGTSDTQSFYCLNKTDGNVKWKISLPMRVYGSAVENDGLIYFGCFDGILRGVDAATGELKWKYQTEASKMNYSTVYKSDGHFVEGFELYGNNVMETERKILKLGSILSTPVIENDIIYFGSTDGVLYTVKIK